MRTPLPSTVAIWPGRQGGKMYNTASAVEVPNIAASNVALLQRSGFRSFRRRAVFRPLRRAAERPACPAAVVDRSLLARHQGEVAVLGAFTLCRASAGARRRRGLAHLLRRPCELSRSDRGPQYAARPGMVEARLAFPLHRAAARQRSGHRLCRPAADRCRAGFARPLRSSRSDHAVAARGRASAARHHAARQ